MIKSKLTSKAQTTIQRSVCAALRLEAGDEIVYRIEGDRVILTPVPTDRSEDSFATFDEWHGDADAKAYAGL